MAEQQQVPVVKPRFGYRPNGGPDVHFLGAGQAMPVDTADMYDTAEARITRGTHRESFPDGSGLPRCVRLRNTTVSAEQKQRDSQLPRLLHDLDEACACGASDVEKGKLVLGILFAASSPIRKYRILRFFELLDNNKDKTGIQKLLGALTILEKYATNLLKKEKPVLWKVVKFNLGIMQRQVFPVKGAIEVLKQMGYTATTENAFTFPEDVNEPDTQSVIVLAADLVIARLEVDSLLAGRHPFLIFLFPGIPDETPARDNESVPMVKTHGLPEAATNAGDVAGGVCGVCGEQNLAKSCKECDMKFCQPCDERWHSHVQRRSHFRINLLNPALKENNDREKTIRTRPIPAPRQRKPIQKPESSDGRTRQSFYEPSSSVAPVTSPSSQDVFVSSPANYPPVVSSYSDLSGVSPSNQEIKRPPSWPPFSASPALRPPTTVSSSPVHVSPSQQSKLAFSAAGSSTAGAQTRLTVTTNPYMGEMNLPPNHSPNNSSAPPAAAANDTISSCTNCHFLVSSAQQSCPSCKFPLQRNVPRMPDLSQSPIGLTSPGGYPVRNTTSPLHVTPGDFLGTSSVEKSPSLSPRPSDPSWGTGAAVYNPPGSWTAPEPLYEEVIPVNREGNQVSKDWSCEHCTFLNPVTTKICQLCFKTPSDLKASPVVAGQLPKVSSSSPTKPALPPDQRTPGAGGDSKVPLGMYETVQDPPPETLYMTPQNLPLEGGIYIAPRHPSPDPPPLPPKKLEAGKSLPVGRVVNAQRSREQELSEKEKGKKAYEEKCQLLRSGTITEEEFYKVDLEFLQGRHATRHAAGQPLGTGPTSQPGLAGYNENVRQLLQAGVISQKDLYDNNFLQYATVHPEQREPELAPKQDNGLNDEQLQKLIEAGVFGREDPYQKDFYRTVPLQKLGVPEPVNRNETKLSHEERLQLYQAGIILAEDIRVSPGVNTQPRPEDIQAMFEEFRMLEMTGGGQAGLDMAPGNVPNYSEVKPTFRDVQNFHMTRDISPVNNIYDKAFAKNANVPPPSYQDFMSLPNRLEDLGGYGFIENQGRMYIKWMKQAEIDGFTPEELNLATNLTWQDPKGRNPVQWLKEEWTNRVVSVIGKVTELTKNENDRIGNLSTEEAKQALLENLGSVESACKSCIESRREKLAKMAEIALYGRTECLNALDNSNGNLENALLELERKALEPIRKRVLRIEDHLDGSPGHSIEDHEEEDRKFKAIVTNKDVSVERRARVIFAEKHMKSWGRVETAIKLIDLQRFSVEDCIEAAEAYGDLERSLGYLQQECPVCMEEKPMGQMITFLSCQDRICKECVTEHLTIRIKERNIQRVVCPVCDKPNLSDEAEATEYFNNLDIMMRQIVSPEVHNLFQQKLRDRTLQKEPNFRWCAHCACGFIYEQPEINKMHCPACQKFTCFSCKKQWQDQHEGISCEAFARWQEENDEGFQLAGLRGHLALNGIDCPGCKFRYDLARGGCMHFKCVQCSHEFCSGCYNPFKHGEKCNVSASCARKGIHAHHPRDCLFYLRDWTPERLQRLLTNHGVDYDNGAEVLSVQDEDSQNSLSDEEVVGAVGVAAAGVCKVMEQKETPDGLQDAECGAPCVAGHDGLCRVHYIETLVSLINRNGIDPADEMDVDELRIVLSRAEIEPQGRERGEDEDLYRERLLNMVKQRLPLPVPPGLAVEEQELEDEEQVDEELKLSI